MTPKKQPKPEKPYKANYKGATPEKVARALLKRRPATGDRLTKTVPAGTQKSLKQLVEPEGVSHDNERRAHIQGAAAAEAQAKGDIVELKVDWDNQAIVNEHIHLCVEAGYLEVAEGSGPRMGGGEEWFVRRVTYAGHRALRNMRVSR